MDTILLIVFAILIVFFSYIIIRSWLYQKQFKKSLQLKTSKNNTILLKQAGGLFVSLIVFVFVLTNSISVLPTQNDAVPSNIAREYVRDALDHYSNKSEGLIGDLESDDITVVGEITLEDNQVFVLVEMDGVYFLIDNSTNSIIEVKPTP